MDLAKLQIDWKKRDFTVEGMSGPGGDDLDPVEVLAWLEAELPDHLERWALVVFESDGELVDGVVVHKPQLCCYGADEFRDNCL